MASLGESMQANMGVVVGFQSPQHDDTEDYKNFKPKLKCFLATTPLFNPCMIYVYLLLHVMKDPFEIYISTSGSFVGGRLCRHIGFNSKLT